MSIRRINLFAGPGAGKSTIAGLLYYHLKQKRMSVELVREVVKDWVYQDITVKGFDQLFLFGSQVRAEDLALRHTNVIVTDSPILLQVAYVNRDNPTMAKPLLDLCSMFDEKYPSVNIFLERNGIEYDPNGRFEDESGAVKMDQMIIDLLESNNQEYIRLNTTDQSSVLDAIDQFRF